MNRREALSLLGAGAVGVAGFGGFARAAEEHKEHASKVQACAKACADCLLECGKAFRHCNERVASGKKEYAKCLDLCAGCGECCCCCADLCSRENPLLHHMCECCAKCCDDCAAECERLRDAALKACIEACRRCAKACREIHG